MKEEEHHQNIAIKQQEQRKEIDKMEQRHIIEMKKKQEEHKKEIEEM